MATRGQSQTLRKPELTNAEAQKRLLEIVGGHDDVMFLNHDEDGRLRARPMARAHLDEDGTQYFATSIDSDKVAELRVDPEVTLSMQGGREYAVVTGVARITQDKALIDQLWSDAWKLWFPDGKDDPSIAIVIVEPTEGTFWDNSKTQGLSFVLRAAKAALTGREVERDPGDSGHAQLGKRRRARV